MRIVFCVVFFVCLFIYIKRFSFDITSRRALSLYVGLWGISLFFAVCEMGGLYRISPVSLFLIYLSLISFVFGFSLCTTKRYPDTYIHCDSTGTIINTISDSRFFQIILIVLVGYVISLFVTFIDAILLQGNLVDVRNDYFGGEEDGMYGPLFDSLNPWILTPFSIILIPIFVYKLFYKRDWICLLSGLYLVFFVSLGGGRFGYIRILWGVVFLMYCLLYKHKKYSNRSSKKKIFRILLILIIGFAFLLSLVTAARSRDFEYGSDNMMSQGVEEFANHTVIYMGGAIVAFDRCVSDNYAEKIGGYQLGKLTLSPFVYLLSPILNKLGFGYINVADISFKQDDPIPISYNGDRFNALYTALFWFYLDFGILGVVIFPFLFGLLLRWSILQLNKRFNMANLVLVFFLFQKIMHFIFDYSFVSFHDLFFFLALYYIGNSRKRVAISY